MELAAALIVLIAVLLAGASFPISVLCAVAVGMVVAQWHSASLRQNDDHSGDDGQGSASGRGQHDSGEDDCSDPACVRCHAYRKVSSIFRLTFWFLVSPRFCTSE